MQCEGMTRNTPVRLRTMLPPRLAPLDTDAERLKQVLFNLVGNALKFTPQGEVTIRVDAEPGSHRPLRIEVCDTGIGIPPDRLGAIFEPFQQADSSTARQYGGTGLGLAISRSLCELLGYRLEVESVVGQGSTFRIVLTKASTALHPVCSTLVSPGA